MADRSEQSGGIGCVGVLLIVFVVLKLTGNIGWSWLWVLSPIWGSLAFIALALIACISLAVMRGR